VPAKTAEAVAAGIAAEVKALATIADEPNAATIALQAIAPSAAAMKAMKAAPADAVVDAAVVVVAKATAATPIPPTTPLKN
jgi:hypothetical protein